MSTLDRDDRGKFRALAVVGISLLVIAVLLFLAGCASPHPTPSFQEKCESAGGTQYVDEKSEFVTTVITGTVTGTVFVNGSATFGTGTGTGVYSGLVNLTVLTCVKDDKITDMEIH